MTRSDHVMVRRTGRAPLRLDGYGLAATATSRTTDGPRQTRWHELEWWSDDRHLPGPEQRHCLVVRYITQWRGELGHEWAEILLRRDLDRVLRDCDPLEHVAPTAGGQSEARRSGLDHALVTGYEHAVSDLLAKAGIVGGDA